MAETIREHLKRHTTRATLMLVPFLLAAGAAGYFGWIQAHGRITPQGWALMMVGFVYLAWWVRATRFPCPKCGCNLTAVRELLPHECAWCGLSLDQPIPQGSTNPIG